MLRGSGGAYESCMEMRQQPSGKDRAERKRRDEAKAEEARRDRETKQREYLAAKQPCSRGDAKACWIVAIHASLNKHDKAEILAALEVACDGNNAQACFELGMMRDDVARLAMACTLGHLRACQMAIAKDPSRAMELDSRACELNDGVACERVAAMYARRGDREETENYLRLACRADRKAACQRLGEMAVGEP